MKIIRTGNAGKWHMRNELVNSIRFGCRWCGIHSCSNMISSANLRLIETFSLWPFGVRSSRQRLFHYYIIIQHKYEFNRMYANANAFRCWFDSSTVKHSPADKFLFIIIKFIFVFTCDFTFALRIFELLFFIRIKWNNDQLMRCYDNSTKYMRKNNNKK